MVAIVALYSCDLNFVVHYAGVHVQDNGAHVFHGPILIDVVSELFDCARGAQMFVSGSAQDVAESVGLDGIDPHRVGHVAVQYVGGHTLWMEK